MDSNAQSMRRASRSRVQIRRRVVDVVAASSQARSLIHAKSQESAENSHESAQNASKTPHTTSSQLPRTPITHRSPVLMKPDGQAGQYNDSEPGGRRSAE